MAKVDVERLKAQYPAYDVAARYLEVRRAGARYVACCPFHGENTPSFVIYEDHFHCYGCQWSGDVIDLVAGMEGGLDFKDAVAKLTGEQPSEPYSTSTRHFVPRDTRDDLTPVIPVPANAPPLKEGERTPPIYNANKRQASSWGAPKGLYRYFTADGDLLGYVLRAEIDGRKITPQVMWCRWEGGEGWALRTFPEPRPLYHPPMPPGNRNNAGTPPVLVVEGEKAADAAARLLGHAYDVVTWPGGCNGVEAAAWEEIMGRPALLWPDADNAGYRAMAKVRGLLLQMAPVELRVVYTMMEPHPPRGWDLADAVDQRWTAQKVVDWAKARAADCTENIVLDLDPEPGLEPVVSRTVTECDAPDVPPAELSPDEPHLPIDSVVEQVLANPHFTVLGYNSEDRFFMPYGQHGTQQVTRIKAHQLKREYLNPLAPLEWWQDMFPSGERGISWQQAAQAMLHTCAHVGIFDPSKVRGRGAWMDGEVPVFHSGETVWRGGEIHEPGRVPGRYKYTKRLDLGVGIGKPLTDEQAHQTRNMIEQLAWEREASGLMLAGWTVLAPVCGVLKWRPHVWITGSSGSGKTTAVNLVEQILGPVSLRAEGISTEPGLRQRLSEDGVASDARPILYDEAEAEDQRSAARLRQILDLVRGSSSGSEVSKGTPSGVAKQYSVRVCFCLSAINPSATHWADTSRITKLVLINEGQSGAEFYKQFVAKVAQIFTPAYASGMLARTVSHMSVLRQNINTMSTAAAAALHSSRMGDQIGALLAGALFCDSTEVVDIATCDQLLKRLDFSDISESAAATDELKLLQIILTHSVRVSGQRGGVDLTYGELAEVVATDRALEGVEPSLARRMLGQVGLKVEKEGGPWFAVANNSEPLATKVLPGTPWAKGGWARALHDLDGSIKSGKNPLHFTSGLNQRAVLVHYKHWLPRRPRDTWGDGDGDDFE